MNLHRLSALGCSTAALALVAAGCGSSSSSSSKAASSGSGSGAGSSGKTYNVVYIPGLTGNPFYTTVACGAQSVAKSLHVNFSVQGAPVFAVPQQTSVVEAVTAKHPDGIMISNDDPKAMIPPLAKAQAAGIKIVNIDGDLAEKSIGVTNVESDNAQGGVLAGQEMGKLTGGKGSILIVDNVPGIPESEARRSGFMSGLKQYPGLKVLAVQYSNNSTSDAATIVKDTALAHPDLAGVYTVETNNTEGALTGIREAHLVGKVKLVGYDTSAPIVAGIQAGTVSADIVQFPFGEGRLGLESMVKALNGQSVPREQTQPFVVATKANINTPKVQQYIYKTTCSS